MESVLCTGMYVGPRATRENGKNRYASNGLSWALYHISHYRISYAIKMYLKILNVHCFGAYFVIHLEYTYAVLRTYIKPASPRII